MKKLQYKMLSDAEKELVLAARPKQLRKLDEDELLALHKRVRRARNKYAELHRRRSSEQVRKDRARGKASKKHRRTAAKAEVFEEVLAKVSQRLAVEARRSSEALKQERLAAAAPRHDGAAARERSPKRHGSGAGQSRRARGRRPVERRRSASERAAKRRHEARRG
jgi:hypothetical protein